MADRITSHQTQYDPTTSARAETIGAAGGAGVRLSTPVAPSQSGSALVYVVGFLAFVLVVLPALMFATRVLTQVGQAMGD